MFDVGAGELLLIVVIVLLLFGPKKIPEVAQMIGKGIREFRKAQDSFKQTVRDISADIETSTDISSVTSTYYKPAETAVSRDTSVRESESQNSSTHGSNEESNVNTDPFLENKESIIELNAKESLTEPTSESFANDLDLGNPTFPKNIPSHNPNDEDSSTT